MSICRPATTRVSVSIVDRPAWSGSPNARVTVTGTTSDDELGAAIAVDIDGEFVVDVWGGYADKAKTRAWRKDTIVNVFSSTKNVTSLAALILIDRGLLDPFAPVAKYWPEFAANGKEHIEVRHIMSHTSGLSGWEMPFTLDDIYDREKSTAQLAAQAPWWTPGTASGYHAVTSGHLIGEVIRRITGKTLKQFVREEIAEPLGADFQIGARPEDDSRIAELIPPPPLDVPLDAVPGDHPMRKTFAAMPPTPESALAAETPAWRGAEIGSANGHGNARSLVRALSPISLNGNVNGVRLLSPETIDLIFQEQANGIDLVLAMPTRWGLGFALPHLEAVPDIPDEKICYWGGWGGSMAVMNPERRTTFGYVMNKMGQVTSAGTERTRKYTKLIYEALT